MKNNDEHNETTDYIIVKDTRIVEKKKTFRKKPKSLKFANLTKIGYFFFMKESFFFILTNILHRLPVLICSIFFKLSNNENYIGINSFAILSMDLVSTGLRDFQEILPIVCGPYYSKGDYEFYRINRNKLVMISMLCFALFFCIIPFLGPMYTLLGVDEKLLEDMVKVSKSYIFCYALFMAVSNFLKGKFGNLQGIVSIRQLHRWFFLMNVFSFSTSILVGYLIIFQTSYCQYGIILSYQAKFLVEIVFLSIILCCNSKPIGLLESTNKSRNSIFERPTEKLLGNIQRAEVSFECAGFPFVQPFDSKSGSADSLCLCAQPAGSKDESEHQWLILHHPFYM